MKKLLWAIILISLLPTTSFAATINATSGSRTHVLAAIASASPNDTISIPADEETWTAYIDVSTDGLKFVGAGIDTTIVHGYGFRFAPGTDNWSVTGFTFDGDTSGPNKAAISVNVAVYDSNTPYMRYAGAKNFRINNNKFKEYSPINSGTWWFCNAILIYGYSYGLIDNNQFVDCLGETIYYNSDNTEAWERIAGLGGYDNGTIFIEDNTFTATGTYSPTSPVNRWNLVDGDSGARIVLRYNSITDANTIGSGLVTLIETHGLCNSETSSANVRGLYSVEVDHNSIYKYSSKGSGATVDPQYFKFRGGRGYVHDNNIYVNGGDGNHGTAQILFYEYRASSVMYTSCYACASCDGDQPCTPNTLCTSYPCNDQINNFYAYNNHKDTNTANGAETWADLVYYIDPRVVHTDDGGLNTYDTFIANGVDYFSETALIGYIPYPYPHYLQTPASVTGTVFTSGAGNIKESEVVSGGSTIILTITGTTWNAFDNTIRAAIVAGLDSTSQNNTDFSSLIEADPGSWSATGVVRTSDTVCAITLPATPTYSITANETITVTIPASAVASGVAIVASPTILISNEADVPASTGIIGTYNASGTIGTYSSGGIIIK